MNTPDQVPKPNSGSIPSPDAMVVEMSDKEKTQHAECMKHCFRKVCYLSLVVIISFTVSVLTTKYISSLMALQPSQKSSSEQIPDWRTPERQTAVMRIGAQMSLNQTLLKDDPPRLAWSHRGSDDYTEGIKHVTHLHGSYSFDCLEISTAGRYLVTIQLTYRFTNINPPTAVKSYVTLTKFRDNMAHLVAKSDMLVPSPRRRSGTATSQPVTIVRSDPLRIGDRICVTASHPDLIYASKIDNFFGIIRL